MQPNVIFGNAQTEGACRQGWFLGHFITPANELRKSEILEVKWGVHQAGDCRAKWGKNVEATTLSLLIRGQFRLKFPEQEFLLTREGDYVLWSAGVPHCWWAELDSIILTIRWPSLPGDSVEDNSLRRS